MSDYNVTCPGCAHPYHDEVHDGLKILVHKNYRLGDPLSTLPTPHCVATYNYVVFMPCRHCCPERFSECPDCQLGLQGRPTPKRC